MFNLLQCTWDSLAQQCVKNVLYLFSVSIFLLHLYTHRWLFSRVKVASKPQPYRNTTSFFFINHAKREELDLQNEMIQQKVIWIFWKKSRQKKNSTIIHQSFQFGVVHKLREQVRREGGVSKMFTLLYNSYLVNWFTRGEGV